MHVVYWVPGSQSGGAKLQGPGADTYATSTPVVVCSQGKHAHSMCPPLNMLILHPVTCHAWMQSGRQRCPRPQFSARLHPRKACDKVPFALYERPASGFVRRGAPIGVRERRRPTPTRPAWKQPSLHLLGRVWGLRGRSFNKAGVWWAALHLLLYSVPVRLGQCFYFIFIAFEHKIKRRVCASQVRYCRMAVCLIKIYFVGGRARNPYEITL